RRREGKQARTRRIRAGPSAGRGGGDRHGCMRIQALFAFAALALGVGLTVAGCGGSPGTATVEGTINKKSLKAVEAVSFDLEQQGFGAGVVLISTDAGVCDLFKAATLHKNMQILE